MCKISCGVFPQHRKKRAKPEPIADVAPNRVSPILAEVDAAIDLIKGNDKLLNSISQPPLGPGDGGSAPSIRAGSFHKCAAQWNRVRVHWEFHVDRRQVYQLPWGSGSAIGGGQRCKDALF